MRIDGYNLNPSSLPPVGKRPATISQREAVPNAAAVEPDAELSPQEKLRRVLEEKRWMSEAAFENPAAGPELGKHIDLRV